MSPVETTKRCLYIVRYFRESDPPKNQTQTSKNKVTPSRPWKQLKHPTTRLREITEKQSKQPEHGNGLYISFVCAFQSLMLCVVSFISSSLSWRGFVFYRVRLCVFNWSQTSHKALLLATKCSLSSGLWWNLLTYQCWDLSTSAECKNLPFRAQPQQGCDRAIGHTYK